jgi:nucleotide-binding universal stress UspA family protein
VGYSGVKTLKDDPAVQNYRKVLVGYDGSDNAKRALGRAIALSACEGAALRIVVSVNTILPVYGTTAPYYPPDYAEQVTREGQKSLAEAVSRAKEANQKVSGSVMDGHPAEMILSSADREGSDLIVLGRRGISGVERFLMGSVSSSVVNHSKCDVLIVK